MNLNWEGTIAERQILPFLLFWLIAPTFEVKKNGRFCSKFIGISFFSKGIQNIEAVCGRTPGHVYVIYYVFTKEDNGAKWFRNDCND